MTIVSSCRIMLTTMEAVVIVRIVQHLYSNIKNLDAVSCVFLMFCSGVTKSFFQWLRANFLFGAGDAQLHWKVTRMCYAWVGRSQRKQNMTAKSILPVPIIEVLPHPSPEQQYKSAVNAVNTIIRFLKLEESNRALFFCAVQKKFLLSFAW